MKRSRTNVSSSESEYNSNNNNNSYSASGKGNNYTNNNSSTNSNLSNIMSQQHSAHKRGAGYNQAGDLNPAMYADAVKAGQRSSQNFKYAWHQYCEANGQQMYDPAKQSVEFIQSFLDALGKSYLNGSGGGGHSHGISPSGGGKGGYGQHHNSHSHGSNLNQGGHQMGGGSHAHNGGYRQNHYDNSYHMGNDMGQSPGFGRNNRGGGGNIGKTADPSLQRVIELVKQGQRNSQDWKNMWIDWCQENGNGVHDPTRHNSCFIIAFVLKFGLAEVVSAAWASNYLVALGELAKPYMVSTIKKGQSCSDIWKEQWGIFADTKANGTRDPDRHDAGTLMEFFDTIALTQFKSESWMMPYVNGSEPNY